MNQVTPETTIGELCGHEEFKPLSDYFFTNMTEDVWNRPLEYYGFEKCGFAETLERIKALVASGMPLIHPVYQEGDDKEGVKLVFMPPVSPMLSMTSSHASGNSGKP